jgi:sugar-specific transcriptional regulator TrmB
LNRKDEHIEIFVKLGLTMLQARIYLTILILHKASVGKISTEADIARPDVYRVLPTLEKIGLVRQVIATHIMYEATPLKEGCQILLDQKKFEYDEVQQKSEDLIRTFQEKNHHSSDESCVESFCLINSNKLQIEKIVIEDSNAQKSIDVIGKWGAIRALVFSNSDVYQQAMKRGVRIRFITDKPNPNDTFLQKWCNSGPLFEVRILEELQIRGAIYDHKTANMCVRTITVHDHELTPSLWSNNHEFVNLLLTYFESLWLQAKRLTDFP